MHVIFLALNGVVASVAKLKRRLTQITLNDLRSRKAGQNAFLVRSSVLGSQERASGKDLLHKPDSLDSVSETHRKKELAHRNVL